MSSEVAINTIETVKKKLEKYTASKQHDKVEEYLHKLHNTTITRELLRATKIDALVSQLASNKTASYYSSAQHLLRKWQEKSASSKIIDSSKTNTVVHAKKLATDRKLPAKRKSDLDDTTDSQASSHSQTSNSIDRDQSSTNKKRKVFSLAEYLGSKNHAKSVTLSNNDSLENPVTDDEAQKIYAEFDAKCKELVAKAPDLANNVEKKLRQNNTTVNNQLSKKSTVESQTNKNDDLWAEDDDEEDDDLSRDAQLKQTSKTTQPVKSKQTSNSESRPSQQVKHSLPVKPSTKIDDHLMRAALVSNISSLGHSQAATFRPTLTQKKPIESIDFLRSKQTRQAIYSGSRTRPHNKQGISSLQDLCVEALKDYVDNVCYLHFNRLPFDIVKPIIDVANPEQLHHIIDNNPDYADDVEPLWQQFCAVRFKDAQREECETYYELYWRKVNEQEQRLQLITRRAKEKRDETEDTNRQTKAIPLPPSQNRTSNKSRASFRHDIPLSSSKSIRIPPKVKKPSITPLLKKTLKAYQGKN